MTRVRLAATLALSAGLLLAHGCAQSRNAKASASTSRTLPDTKEFQPTARSTAGLTANSAANAPADVALGRPSTTFDPYAVSMSGETRTSGSGAARGVTDHGVSFFNDSFAGEQNTNPQKRQAGPNQTQVTFSNEGADFDPDVSRDGSIVVFASTQHGPNSDIYVKSLRSMAVTQITSGPFDNVMPKVSPDGSRVAFASNRSGNWDIYIMPTSGGNAVQLTSTIEDDLHPSWSPDGQSLVFCRLGSVSGKWELWVVDTSTSGVKHFIGYGLFPEWCPASGTGENGSDKILFQRSKDRGDRAFSVWTCDYKDAACTNITEVVSSQYAACINPTWSPDGRWIAFATVPNPTQWAKAQRARPDAAGLWMVDLAGGGRINVAAGKTVNLMPHWANDGRLYFVSDRSGTDNIWSIGMESAVALASGVPLPEGFASGNESGASSRSGRTPVVTVPDSFDSGPDRR